MCFAAPYDPCFLVLTNKEWTCTTSCSTRCLFPQNKGLKDIALAQSKVTGGKCIFARWLRRELNRAHFSGPRRLKLDSYLETLFSGRFPGVLTDLLPILKIQAISRSTLHLTTLNKTLNEEKKLSEMKDKKGKPALDQRLAGLSIIS